MKIKRIISGLLIFVIVFCMIPISMPAAKAATLSLSELRAKFPHGRYWNHAYNPGSSNSVNNQDGTTDKPCTKHGGYIGTSQQTCNGFQPNGTQLSWQCMGYAEKLGYDATGYNPRNNANGWQTYTTSSALNNLKPGDIVRYKNDGHSIYVIAVSGDTVTYTDCNSGSTMCMIRWDQTISKATLKSTFTHVRSAPVAISAGYEIDTRYPTPFYAYTISSAAKTQCYDYVDGPALSTNNIYNTDECTIQEVYTNGWCKFLCPWSGGSVATKYAPISTFIYDTNYNPNYQYLLTDVQGYKRHDLSESYKYADINGNGKGCLRLGNTGVNGYTQIMYWISGYGNCVMWVEYPGSQNDSLPIGSDFYAYIIQNEQWRHVTNDNTNVSLRSETGEDNQIWKFVYQGNGYYKILSCADGKALDVYGAYSDSGTNVQVYPSHDSDAQLWRICGRWNGEVTLEPKCSTCVLDLYNNDISEGANIQIWSYHGGTAQRFSLYTDVQSTLKYNANGGSGAPASCTKAYLTTFNLSTTIPTRSGYTFLGWSTSSNATTPTYKAGERYVMHGSTTLYAVWKEATYTIKYDANGGSGAPSSQTKYYGTNLTLSSAVPTGSYYTVSFDSNGGSSVTSSKKAYKTFKEWNTNADGSGTSHSSGASFATDSDTTLYAQWNDAKLGENPIPTREGYQFIGWFNSKSTDSTGNATGKLYIDSTTVSGNVTLYAMWAPNDHLVFGDANRDGAVNNDDINFINDYNNSKITLDYDLEEFLLRCDHGRDGDIGFQDLVTMNALLLGRVTQSDCASKISSISISQLPKISYKYGESLNTDGIKLQFDFTNGTNLTISKNIKVTGYDPYKSGQQKLTASFYQFSKDFYVTVDANLVVNSSNTAIISTGGEMEYYTFTPSASGKYVIYSTGEEDYKVYLYDSSGTELDNNDDDGDGRNFRLEYNFTAGTTYKFGVKYYSSSKTGTIPFKFGRVYTITFDANNGLNAPSSQNKDYGIGLILGNTIPTRDGYTFLGWSTSSTATTATYQAGGTYSSESSVTLYAVWTKGCPNNTHSYTTKVTAPTCTAQGYTTHTCTVCGENYTDTYVNAKGHSWSEYTSNNDATVNSDGTKSRTCSTCGAKETVTDIGSQLDNIVKGTCGDNVDWSLNLTTGVLTISGTGDMYDYGYGETPSWNSYKNSITSVVISKGVTSIGDCTFESHNKLTSATISDGVTSIGELAFAFCTALKKITIPYGVEDIETLTFYGCTNLTDVILADSVASIATEAFSGCRSLKNISVSKNLTHIEGFAFAECTELQDENGFIIVNNILCDYNGSDTTVTIPYGVTTIGEWSLYNCTNIQKIIIPESVTYIGEEAFFVCGSLATIVLPYSIETIDDLAFDTCTNLTSVIYAGDRQDRENISIGSGNDDLLNATWTYHTHIYSNLCDSSCNSCAHVRTAPHSYTSKVTAPTCTTQGYTTYTCSSCGNSYKDSYVNATNHSYSYKATKTPTAAATGTITGTCSKCSKTTSITLPKLNTTDYTYSVTKAATCTVAGTGCYTWKTKTYGTYKFNVTITSTGHTWGDYIYNNDATTEADGTETRTCESCGATETRTAEGTKLPETPSVIPDSRLPKVEMNESGNGVTLNMLGSWATRVYWGYIGEEEIPYTWFDDFRLGCGTEYNADFTPRADKTYSFTKKGYYRFVLKCIISGDSAENYEYKDMVYTFYYDGSVKPAVPYLKVIDGNTVQIEKNGLAVTKLYYGNIGSENVPYGWFNDFWGKALGTKTYKVDFGVTYGEKYTLVTKGFYNFVIVYKDEAGATHEIVYTVEAKQDVGIITASNGKATLTVDNVGGKVNKLYYGYIGTDATGVVDYDTLKAAAGTLTGDWTMKTGRTYNLTKTGYYGFCVNYTMESFIKGAFTNVTYDIIYIVENK